MASFKNNINSATDSRHLTELIHNLTIDDQRMLARILNNWDNRDQRKQLPHRVRLSPNTRSTASLTKVP